METKKVRSCAICGTLFMSYGSNICAACLEQVDEAYKKIREYMYRAQDGVHVKALHEQTGVSERIILYLMKEGRLVNHEVKDGNLKCVACGAPISSGKLCPKCAAVWSASQKRADAKQKISRDRAGYTGTGEKCIRTVQKAADRFCAWEGVGSYENQFHTAERYGGKL